VQPTHLDARAPLPRPLAATAVFKLQGDASGSRMSAGVEGTIGDLTVRTDARLQGSHLAAHVEIPHATAEAVASLVPVRPPPTIPLRVPVSAVIDAEGDLPDIDFKTRLTLENSGSLSVDGKIGLRSSFTLDAGLKVDAVDPRAILDVASATPLSATGHVHLEAGKDVRIDAEATTEPFALAGNPVPRVNVKAVLADGVWKAAATVDEPGAPVHGTFTFDPAARDLGFDVEGKVPSLRGVARLKLPVDGSATVSVKGSLRDGTLDAAVTARAGGVHAETGAVALESGGVDARVKGKLDALEVDATIVGSGVQAGFYSWQDVTAHVRGPVQAPRIDA
jgi:translocation and assembly module TamB